MSIIGCVISSSGPMTAARAAFAPHTIVNPICLSMAFMSSPNRSMVTRQKRGSPMDNIFLPQILQVVCFRSSDSFKIGSFRVLTTATTGPKARRFRQRPLCEKMMHKDEDDYKVAFRGQQSPRRRPNELVLLYFLEWSALSQSV